MTAIDPKAVLGLLHTEPPTGMSCLPGVGAALGINATPRSSAAPTYGMDRDAAAITDRLAPHIAD